MALAGMRFRPLSLFPAAVAAMVILGTTWLLYDPAWTPRVAALRLIGTVAGIAPMLAAVAPLRWLPAAMLLLWGALGSLLGLGFAGIFSIGGAYLLGAILIGLIIGTPRRPGVRRLTVGSLFAHAAGFGAVLLATFLP